MERLNEGNGANANNAIISGVLVTVGDLARVVCSDAPRTIDLHVV